MAKSGENNKEVVVLLHGILKNKFDMAAIAAYLRTKDYDVINLSYPSRHHTIEELADNIYEQLQDEELAGRFNSASKVHFVTHSMGGLVSRYFLHKYRPENLGRVVMLSPPNQGSDFANWMMETESFRQSFNNHKLAEHLDEQEARQKIFQNLFGPAGQQLHTDYEHSIEPSVDFPLGVIAGNRSINPLAPWVLGDDPHDGIVPIERMKIDGMTDMIEVNASHMLMILNLTVMKQVDHFLKNERFDHGPAPM